MKGFVSRQDKPDPVMWLGTNQEKRHILPAQELPTISHKKNVPLSHLTNTFFIAQACLVKTARYWSVLFLCMAWLSLSP